MTDFSKKESISVLKKHGWTYHGFLDIGWGEKFYVFSSPEKVKVEMKLGQLRRKAYSVDMYHWLKNTYPAAA